MRELGRTPVRVRDLTRGGYKEQVRGYCRDARNESLAKKQTSLDEDKINVIEREVSSFNDLRFRFTMRRRASGRLAVRLTRH